MKRKLLILTWGIYFLVGLITPIQADEATPINLKPYKGKVVLVDFWASWCSSCRKSFPWLNKMQKQKAAQGLVIIGVNVDENAQDAAQFLKETPATFQQIYDSTGSHANYYKVLGMPSTLIFDRQGKLQHQHVGFKENKITEYEQTIDQILNQ